MAVTLGDAEALVAEIRRRAHQRAVGIEQEARERADGILADARREGESMQQRSQQDVDARLATLARWSAARCDLEVRRRLALLREAPLDRVWAAAEARLRQLVEQPGYDDVLQRLALVAARELGATACVLAADPAGHALLVPERLDAWSNEARCHFQRATEPAATWGGLVATSGRARVDVTFQTQLALARRALREQVFHALSEPHA